MILGNAEAYSRLESVANSVDFYNRMFAFVDTVGRRVSGQRQIAEGVQ